jgi:transcriptional regulator with XRE-family HTH domain
MARAALQLGVRDLAKLANVSAMTITRFENEQSGGQAETLRKLQSALEAAGVMFITENGGGPGVRLKNRSTR